MTSLATSHTPPSVDGARAAAIDLDGILLDGMQYHIHAWHEAFGPYALEVDDRQLYLLEGIKTRDVIDLICGTYGLELSGAEKAAIAKVKKDVYRAVFEPTPLDGAGELLETLNQHGYQVAIVTGTLATSAVDTLDKLRMRDYVAHIISAEMDIPGKPDPAPFRLAGEYLGVARDHCLAVDNAPAGIASAIGAGLPCAGVATYLEEDDLREAGRVFAGIRELAFWLRSEHERSGGRGAWGFGGSSPADDARTKSR